MKLFEGKRITVMGLGVHGGGIGNVRWLHEQGARLTVTDLKTSKELAESIALLHDLHDITWVLGEHRAIDFTDADMILRNPAVPRDSQYLRLAREAGVAVEMDSSLFLRYCPTKNIIGVTGSKGKTTATTAMAHLMQLVFSRAVMVGVEQTSPLPELSRIKQNEVVVFELSSWRLEALGEKRISPHTAIITSLYRDHLNTYGSFEEYIEAKKNIIRYQTAHGRVILNYDDPLVRTWRDEAKGQVFWFSMGDSIPDDGIYIRRGIITIQLRGRSIGLFPLESIPRDSVHERRNILPAILLAFINGAQIESLRLHLLHLSQTQHRLEVVRKINGVTYINDSAATIPDATMAALEAMNNHYVVLIVGGSDKNLQFQGLAERVRESKVRALIFLPGTATEAMRSEILAAYRVIPPYYDVKSMLEAVTKAKEVARPGDRVLLSPGATSFGLFQHEFDRGDQFREHVNNL